jgi:hypothetical protein
MAPRKVNTLIASRHTDVMAINELEQQRKRLEEFQVQARFAV